MLAMLATLTVFATAAPQEMDHSMHHGDHHAAEMTQASSTTFGDVRTADADTRMALIRHGDMPELGMSGMVMAFHVADSVDWSLFRPGAALEITVINTDDGLEIIAAEPEAD